MHRRVVWSCFVLAGLASGCTTPANATPRPLAQARAPWTRFELAFAPRGSRPPRGLPENATPDRPHTFRDAKHALNREVYASKEARREIYCGCAYDEARAIDPAACGYEAQPRGAERASRMEWDHAVPFSRFGRLLPCYREPGSRSESHREHCVAVDADARAMEGDMHNLFPSLGQINALREDFELDEIDGEARIGACDFERDARRHVAEPRPEARGELARAYLYMHVTYRLPLTDAERERYLRWHRADPPTAFERERNRRIRALQGNENPFVTSSRTR